jgi:hypothetical protein
VAPADPEPSTAAIDVEAVAAEIARTTGWALDPEVAVPEPDAKRRPFVLDFEREEIGDGIYHYFFVIDTGPGEFDQIGLHRVVREQAPFRPIRSRTSIFLQHGDIKDFKGMFLPGLNSPRQPDDLGFAVHLAQADLDVWGIDQAWALVPADVTDFGFMADWGLDRAMDDLEIGIAVARTLRLFTGNGWRKMQLLGYSSGAATGMAYLEREAQRPRGLRHVNAFVAADYGLVSNDPGWQAATCGDVAIIEEEIAAGLVQFPNPFVAFGPPALDDPAGDSELIPGFTNLQAALALGVYQAYDDLGYHFLAGTFDQDGVPTGLQYTEVDDWIDFMVYAPPFEANQFILDYSRVVCTPDEVPWGHQLGDVTVPLFWLEAAGGAAPGARYSLEVIGSSDITELVISFYPPEDILLDFAHIDLFIGTDAPALAWDPVRDWVIATGWR